MTNKRGRGRPKGSGINDDREMRQIADMLLENPKLKPTTAMHRILRDSRYEASTDTARIRRWQDKWKVGKELFLAEASERRSQREQAAMRADLRRGAETILTAVQRLNEQLRQPGVQLAMDNMMKQIREPLNAMQAFMHPSRELTAALQQIASPPWIKDMLKQHKAFQEQLKISGMEHLMLRPNT